MSYELQEMVASYAAGYSSVGSICNICLCFGRIILLAYMRKLLRADTKDEDARKQRVIKFIVCLPIAIQILNTAISIA